MEASALTRAPSRGLLARRSPLLRFEDDERLVELIRAGHDGAFEVLFTRYNSRLLGFCQSMLKSRQDAEDVLQEVFTNAHSAMLADERKINLRPWLYRIARNRCLNHLRRPVPEGQDSMDIHPHAHGTTTAEHVQNREDLRQLMADVETLPETQRTALLLREIDQLSYEEIAQAMQTTVPSVKSLLVRARIALAESGQARMLTCDDVQLTLAEAAEGIGKASGAERKHVRSCDGCKAFRNQLRSDHKAMAALFPVGILALLKGGIMAKLFGGGTAAGTAAGGSTAAGAAGGASAASGISGAGLLGGAVGAKAAVGFATAALLTAGAVEVRNIGTADNDNPVPKAAVVIPAEAVVRDEPTHLAAATVAPDSSHAEKPAPQPQQTDFIDRDAPSANPAAENANSAPATKSDAEDPAVDPAADDGTVAIGTPVDPATDGSDDQDTGSAPIDPAVPTVPTVSTPPVTTVPGGPPVVPDEPTVDPTLPVDPALPVG